MGKKSMSKDRAYITASEWRDEWGGAKSRTGDGEPPVANRLPFYCCAISFTPFEDPVCTADGYVFDILNVVPYIKKFGKHPVTGQPLAIGDLVKLHFHKNADGEYHCPVLNKVFTESTHIVAVRTSGNVYCHDALAELNFKPKNWRDLLSDTPFTRKDVIVIQDPLNLSGRVLAQFDHVKKGISAEPAAKPDELNTAALSSDVRGILGALGTAEAKKALEAGGGGRAAEAERRLALSKVSTAPAAKAAQQSQTALGMSEPLATFRPGASTWNSDAPEPQRGNQPATALSAADAALVDPYAELRFSSAPTTTAARAGTVGSDAPMRTSGAMSRSFTSTVAPTAVVNEALVEEVWFNPTKKGYLKIHTTHGDLNVELDCDLAPRTCQNFLGLCRQHYYDGVIFHRSIKNFMLQGGDPTGTGTCGQSIWGRPFMDEPSKLTHSGRGVLSMANSGKHTNRSQFFILYKSAPHLDHKHTVFAKVVGGMETLTAMERVPTDSSDRPREEIRIIDVQIYVDPYDEELQARRAAKEKAAAAEAAAAAADARGANETGSWWSNPGSSAARADGATGTGVGKYLRAGGALAAAAAPPPREADEEEQPSSKRAKVQQAGFGDFSGW